MEKSNTNKKLFIIYFLIEFILYISFISLDILKLNGSSINNNISLILKYSSIVINFLMATFCLIKKRSQGFILIILAFLFTLISDYLLLFKKTNLELCFGVLIFFFVQLFYFIRFMLYTNKKKHFIVSIIIRVLLPLAICFILILFFNDFATALIVLVIFYFINLVMNLIDSFIDKKYWILSIAFLLFIACDVSIGITQLNYNDISYVLRWVFYLPFQILLFIGSYKYNK